MDIPNGMRKLAQNDEISKDQILARNRNVAIISALLSGVQFGYLFGLNK